MKKHGVKGFFASPFFLIFANKKNMKKNPDLFFENYGNKIISLFFEIYSIMVTSRKNRGFLKVAIGSEKWTFINVQNGFFFFQFGTIKCRSLDITIRI
jgi:hypothetical protein